MVIIRPFIRGGYRCGYSLSETLFSVFSMHNETLNIWTHIIGNYIVLFVFIYKVSNDSDIELATMDRVVYWLYYMSGMVCLTCSAVYHIFNAYSPNIMFLDYTGIIVLLWGSNLPMIIYGFCERQDLVVNYIILTTYAALRCWVDILVNRASVLRTSLLLISFGWCQMVHEFWLFGDVTGLSSYVIVFGIYGLGLVFYVTNIPERFWPGRFDIFFSSHQFWHVAVVLGIAYHFETIVYYTKRCHLRKNMSTSVAFDM
jgi:adiponectin receptor